MATGFGEGEFLVRHWLDQWSWAAARELSTVTGTTVQNVNRHLGKMKTNGVAEYRVVGRGRKAVPRWIFTSEKKLVLPPYDHDHDHDETGRGADGHRHHPRLVEMGHTHVWWWQSEFGHQRIFDMLGPNTAFRDVALRLFPEASGAWLANVGDVVELTNWDSSEARADCRGDSHLQRRRELLLPRVLLGRQAAQAQPLQSKMAEKIRLPPVGPFPE